MRPEDSTPYDVSLIITAHGEGRLAHRSVKSARRAVSFAQQQGIKVELIAILDRPSAETLAYFEEQEQLFDLIQRVDFCDPGLSRNQGAEISRGRYLTFLDAGDLISENWLAASFQFSIASSDQTFVLHPELSLCFGRELFLVEHIDSTSPDYSPLNLIKCDYWGALSFVSSDFFLNGNHYLAIDPANGFGHEDWHWNCETIARGAIHRVVPETVRFARLKSEHTDFEMDQQGRLVIRPTRLFDDTSDALTRNRPPAQTDFERAPTAGPFFRRDLRGFLSLPYRSVRKIGVGLVGKRPRLSRFYADIASATKRLLTSTPTPETPRSWLINEWRRIHEIEPELFPSPEIIRSLAQYRCQKSAIVSHYPEISALIGPAPTHIFLLPWLKYGGSDLEAIHLMTTIVEEDRDSRVACLTTENSESPWIGKLPKEVRLVEFGKLLANFSEDERAMLLLRLLLQKRPRVIHNIHSRLCYMIFSDNGRALAAQSSLFVSMFCEDISPEGRTVGYAFDYLPRVMSYLSGVFTDSRRFANKLCDLYGFEKERFSVLYFPVANSPQRKELKVPEGLLHILWAGRLDRQKRPDVLIKIASELIGLPIHFHVYGDAVLDPYGPVQLQKLKQLPNVTTYGRYDGFESIPATKYDVFLYTSQWDGLPNVLLEATAAGLPVVAPDVGGIKELINESTGFLVSHPEAVGEYVEYLKRILDDYEIVIPKVKAARALVATRHSWNSFVSSLRQVPRYFSEAVFTTTRS